MFYSTLITVSYNFCLSGLAKSVPNYVLAVASIHARHKSKGRQATTVHLRLNINTSLAPVKKTHPRSLYILTNTSVCHYSLHKIYYHESEHKNCYRKNCVCISHLFENFALFVLIHTWVLFKDLLSFFSCSSGIQWFSISALTSGVNFVAS